MLYFATYDRMKHTSSSMQKNIPVSTVPVSISLGDFPDGLYRISFSINNPLLSIYVVSVSKSNNKKDFVLLKSDKQKDFFYIQFRHNSIKEKSFLTITVQQKEGDPVFLKIINQPALIDKSILHNVANEKLYTGNRLNLLFNNSTTNNSSPLHQYKPIDPYAQLLSEIVRIQTDIQNTSAPKLPSGFYELLDLKNAKEQLDYVVKTKIHLHTNGNFVSKPLKKTIKYLFTFIYKVLTRSTLLKTYIAKIYRNYVNMNILSERTLL